MEGQLWRSKWLLMEGKGEKCVMFSPSLHAAAEAFWFKRINGSAQGYFSLTGAVQNNTPGPYFLEEPYALHPLFLLPPLPLTIGEVIRHERLGLQHEWMSSCNAPMTFCHSLLDLLKRREGGERKRKKVKGKCKKRGLHWNLWGYSVQWPWCVIVCLALPRADVKWTDWQKVIICSTERDEGKKKAEGGYEGGRGG